MSKPLKLLPMLAFAAATFAATAALAAAGPPGARSCFRFGDLQAWKSPAPNVLLFKVGASRVFRLDLQQGSNQLRYSDARLINRNVSSTWLCDPLDFNLLLTDRQGTWSEPLIVTSMRQLTPEEIDAIPPGERP